MLVRTVSPLKSILPQPYPYIAEPPSSCSNSTMMGSLGGLMDAASQLGFRVKGPLPDSFRFFKDGWGDLARVDAASARFRDMFCCGRPYPELVDLQCTNTSQGLWKFESPLADFLPTESKTACFQFVPTSSSSQRCIMCIFPGTADTTYFIRKHGQASPLARCGISCILPLPPMYGERKPVGQFRHYPETVESFMLQSFALQAEALVLLAHYKKMYPQISQGVMGFSWGGGMAAGVGSIYDRSCAIIPLCGSAGPDVIIKGILKSEIAWERLPAVPPDTAESKLLEVFQLQEQFRELMRTSTDEEPKVVYQVYADCDLFVPEAATMELHQLLKEKVDPTSKLVPTSGGHASSMLFSRWQHTGLVLSCVDELERRRVPRSRL